MRSCAVASQDHQRSVAMRQRDETRTLRRPSSNAPRALVVCRASELDPVRGAAARPHGPQSKRNPARRSSRCRPCIENNVQPYRRAAHRCAHRAWSRGLGSSSDMIAGILSPLSHRSYFPWSRGSLSIASPWNPRVKKVRPRVSPRPYPIGTGYIRLCLQLLHCVTLIAAVNECPVAQMVNAASSGSGAMRRRDEAARADAVGQAHMK